MSRGSVRIKFQVVRFAREKLINPSLDKIAHVHEFAVRAPCTYCNSALPYCICNRIKVIRPNRIGNFVKLFGIGRAKSKNVDDFKPAVSERHSAFFAARDGRIEDFMGCCARVQHDEARFWRTVIPNPPQTIAVHFAIGKHGASRGIALGDHAGTRLSAANRPVISFNRRNPSRFTSGDDLCVKAAGKLRCAAGFTVRQAARNSGNEGGHL